MSSLNRFCFYYLIKFYIKKETLDTIVKQIITPNKTLDYIILENTRKYTITNKILCNTKTNKTRKLHKTQKKQKKTKKTLKNYTITNKTTRRKHNTKHNTWKL